jgi:aspartyl-tRNA(Asn)/glutamyl-tRNA(Gln) amidotransferase subunit A
MLRERPNLYEEDVRIMLEAGELIPATDYITALRVRQKMKLAWQALYRDVDVIVGPAVASPASLCEQETVSWSDGLDEPVTSVFVRLSAPANVTGLPSIAVPCGFSRNGLPVAFQAIGSPFGESLILRLAHAYQSATDWHIHKPSL